MSGTLLAKVPSRLGRPAQRRPQLPPKRRRAIGAADDPERRRPGFNKKRPRVAQVQRGGADLGAARRDRNLPHRHRRRRRRRHQRGGVLRLARRFLVHGRRLHRRPVPRRQPGERRRCGGDMELRPSSSPRCRSCWCFLGRTDTRAAERLAPAQVVGGDRGNAHVGGGVRAAKGGAHRLLHRLRLRRRLRHRRALRREETWALSAGLGFDRLAFVAELGSPRRYSRAELDVLEAQYDDFVAFADEALEPVREVPRERGGASVSEEVRQVHRGGAQRQGPSDDDPQLAPQRGADVRGVLQEPQRQGGGWTGGTR